tara:strand:- start:12 stop:686 length:675 start_codon:yes stop_codon:yes gene_type:complete
VIRAGLETSAWASVEQGGIVMHILFAHGFEGSPSGSKPTYFQDQLGHQVTAPLLHTEGWTIKNQASVLLQALDDDDGIDILVGSSMGGLAASIVSSWRPERKIGVLLLAPAFGCISTFVERLTVAEQNRWREEGSHTYHHHGVGTDIDLPWSFIDEGTSLEWTLPQHPTIIIHGREDDLVPIENSLDVAHRSSAVMSVHCPNDGHRLKESQELMAIALERLASV